MMPRISARMRARDGRTRPGGLGGAGSVTAVACDSITAPAFTGPETLASVPTESNDGAK